MAEQDRHKGAIDAAREEFLFLSISEMIAEFSEYQLLESISPQEPAQNGARREVVPASDEGARHALCASQEPTQNGARGESVLGSDEGAHHAPFASKEGSAPGPHAAEQLDARILCIPAHDRADEITASMLAQLLEQKGLAALSFPIAESSPNEWLALIGAGPSDVICISALPPYAFAPARAMCKQIRERFPKLKMVVCVWGFSGDTQKAKARFERAQPDRLSTSLAEALKHVEELVRPKVEATPLVA